MPLPTTSTVVNGGLKPQFDWQMCRLAVKLNGLVKVRFDVLFGTMIGGPVMVIVPPTTVKEVPLMVAPPSTLVPPKNPPTSRVAPAVQGKQCI